MTKKVDLIKKTLNLRRGDFEKMGHLFPDLGPSAAVRELLAKFVDKHYSRPQPEEPLDD